MAGSKTGTRVERGGGRGAYHWGCALVVYGCARQPRLRIALVAMCVAMMAHGPLHGQPSPGVCGPSQLGSPCAEGGPATLPLAGGPGLAVGNPVNLATGGKYQRETDMPALPGVLGLELVRHYNSHDTRDGLWGVGWASSYDTRLFRMGARVQIVQADGSRIDFTLENESSGACVPLDPAHGELRLVEAGRAYVWRWRNGRQLTFDAQGWLTSVAAPTGQRVRIRRSSGGHPERGRILRILDPQGRELAWRYDARGRVAAIATPAGIIAYQYADDAARLAAAIYPDGHWRGYLYEAAYQGGGDYRLTGILAGTPEGSASRLVHWIYDTLGRVVATGAGAPGQPGLRLAYSIGRDGRRTVAVTDAEGRTSRLQATIAGGRHVLLRAEGAACPACAPPGSRATYDAWGRPASVNDVRIMRDGLGRITELDEGEVRVAWWRDSVLPAEVELPSVVQGRRRRIEFVWEHVAPGGGETPVPVRIRESGWRPAGPAGGAAMALGEAGPVVRTFHLDWRDSGTGLELAGVRTDGPMHAAAPAPVPGMGDGAPWPGLRTVMDDFGQVVQWSAIPTGTESHVRDAAGRLARRRFANGGLWRYDYDAEHRPIAMTAQAPDAPEIEVHITYGDGGISIANGQESETRGYDARGLLATRTVRRATDGAKVRGDWSYRERFEYDPQGRPTWHWLPEGGALRYHWGAGRRLRGVDWIDEAGRRSVLIEAGGGDGYRYGNGVRVRAVLRNGRLAALAHLDGAEPIWAQALAYDAGGRIIREHVRHRGAAVRTTLLGYDAASRLVAVEGRETEASDADAAPSNGAAWRIWRAWGDDGALVRERRWHADAAAPSPEPTLSGMARDASGLPLRIGARRLEYGADRRLSAVYENGRQLAGYRHNAWGERIYREDAEGASHYLFSGQRLVAEWRGAAGRGGVVRRYVYAQGVPVAMIVYAEPQPLLQGAARRWARLRAGVAPEGPRARVYAIHADALGAPRVLTDETGRVAWRADYTPWGKVSMAPAHLDPGLRLPGQMADPATGWHDNYLRTYDADAGHYLEPDPLGPAGLLALTGLPPGWGPYTSPYGYAAQQPLRYADPLGLVLFAFDGTRESLRTATNVSQLALLYQNAADAARGLPEIHYLPGPGERIRPTLDAALASSGAQIVAQQWMALLRHLAGYQAAAEVADIDLIGYSRGAALARHFGNALAGAMRQGRFWHWEAGMGAVTACANLRFMGLFDSVAQFGLLGSENDTYDFSIAPDWSAVAHAVALHERRGLFPLLSAAAADGVLPANVLELPFVGAHGDIGGGLAVAGPVAESHDLSDVALGWMAEQARRAGVTLAPLPAAKRVVSDPVLHDMRPSSRRRAEQINDVWGWHSPDWPPSDRAVASATDARLAEYQADHAGYGRTRRQEVENFIHRIEGWLESSNPVVGVIDMPAYEAWLAARE